MLHYNITLLASIARMNKAVSKNKILSPFKPVGHKHQKCLQSAIEAAKKHCDVVVYYFKNHSHKGFRKYYHDADLWIQRNILGFDFRKVILASPEERNAPQRGSCRETCLC